MGRIIINVAVVLFTAICYPCVMINAQDLCETERYTFITSENSSINCSLALSGVVNLVISRSFSSALNLNLVCGNNTDVCQDGIMNYFTACRSIEVVSEEEKAVSYGCTINPRSESYCASDYSLPINPQFRRDDLSDVFAFCVTSYFNGVCSFQCNNFLQRYAESAGCCYNEALKTFFGNSTTYTEDEYEIVANNYFTLCNLRNPGFCVDTPSSSSCSLSLTELFQNNSTRNCSIIIRNLVRQFRGILTDHDAILSLASIPRCLEYYLAYLENCSDFTSTSSRRDSERACLRSAITMFGQNNSCGNTADPLLRTIIRTSSSSFRSFEDILEVQNASEIMCRIPECTDNLKSYINSCDIQTNLTDLLCHGINGRSCLALQQSGILNTFATSYERYGSQCFATVISACTSSCREIIREAADTAGCCAYEYLRFLIIQDNLTHVYSADRLYEACSVDSGRCGLVTDSGSRVAYSLSVGIFIIISTLLSM